jgi:hypothetical protein
MGGTGRGRVAATNPVLVLGSMLRNEQPEFLQAYFESGNSNV